MGFTGDEFSCTMRLCHLADSHLGAAGFSRRISPDGFNQREEDIVKAFVQAINKIMALKPDIVVHSGDLFHSVRPSNRIINIALTQIKRFSEAQIPFIIISGNHDTPKQRNVGSVLSLFEHFPQIYPVYKSQYECIELSVVTRAEVASTTRTTVAIHAVGHCLTPNIFAEQLKQVFPGQDAGYNLLVLHGVVNGIPQYSMGDLGEAEISEDILNRGFDYVALGHFHWHCQPVLAKPVFYAGSSERLSFGEVGQDKGFIEYDLLARKMTFHRLEPRPMIDLPFIDASGMAPQEVWQAIDKVIQQYQDESAIARLKIRNISGAVYNGLPFTQLQELRKHFFHFDLKFEKTDEKRADTVGGKAIGHLEEEFRIFLNQTVIPSAMSGTGFSKDELFVRGQKFFKAAEKPEEEMGFKESLLVGGA